MVKSLKYFLPFFLLLATGSRTYAQDIVSTLEKWNSNMLQEKVFVSTDKTFYVTGEIIWFKVFKTDAQNLPNDFSKVVYIEVMSGDKAVLQGKIGIEEGTGNGSFFIPASLGSGNYILRAYTNWMKNFSPDLFFHSKLTIINPMKKPIWNTAENNHHVEFFPEGGNLVAGLESNMAFMVHSNGRPVKADGIIIEQQGDTIQHFQTSEDGYGKFLLTPTKGKQYLARVRIGNIIIDGKLPEIYDAGLVMQLKTVNNQIAVEVQGNDKYNNAPVYLVIHSGQRTTSAEQRKLQDGKTTFSIDRNKISEGISHITLFNEQRIPICERLYFTKPTKQLQLDIASTKGSYSLKEKVELAINTKNDKRSMPANLSLSVIRIDSLQQIPADNIFNYLWLESELGSMRMAGSYLSDGSDVSQGLDMRLLTHGWRRFDWKQGVTNKPVLEFLPEYEGHIVRGKISRRNAGAPAPGIGGYLSIPGKQFEFNASRSDKNGDIQFIVRNFTGSNEVIVQTNYEIDSIYRVDIANPFSDKTSSWSLDPFNISSARKNDIQLRLLGAQAQNAYQPEKLREFINYASVDTNAFYGIPDKKYWLDDYVRFVTMEEVMREYVEEVRIKKRREDFHFNVKNAPYKSFFDEDPLVLLDGVPVFNINKIVAFDPLKVKKIDVVAQRYYYGHLVNNGIVSFSTYDGDLGGYQLDPNTLVVEYAGLQLQRQFYSPQYENVNLDSRIPDFRNVLYWNPDVNTDNSGKAFVTFFTSELPGTYAVIVQGITTDGYAGQGVFTFTVAK